MRTSISQIARLRLAAKSTICWSGGLVRRAHWFMRLVYEGYMRVSCMNVRNGSSGQSARVRAGLELQTSIRIDTDSREYWRNQQEPKGKSKQQ